MPDVSFLWTKKAAFTFAAGSPTRWRWVERSGRSLNRAPDTTGFPVGCFIISIRRTVQRGTDADQGKHQVAALGKIIEHAKAQYAARGIEFGDLVNDELMEGMAEDVAVRLGVTRAFWSGLSSVWDDIHHIHLMNGLELSQHSEWRRALE